jgi:hypothetical protein
VFRVEGLGVGLRSYRSRLSFRFEILESKFRGLGFRI